MQNESGASVQAPEKPPLADDIDLSNFPTTRYQGSKRKIIPWLWQHFRELEFNSALDVFGGTGSVSYLFKTMGKKVTYNDYLCFNHLTGTALIENDEVTLTPEDINAVLEPVANPTHGVVSEIFKGVYFTKSENRWIDDVISRIEDFPDASTEMRYKRALLYYALFQSCLIKRPFNLFHRRNLYLRLARVERQFGNKTSWEIPFRERFIAFCNEANLSVFKGAQRCSAVRYNALEIPEGNYDLAYLDPPYLAQHSHNETSDYRRCYHFLEGLCDYRNWAEMINYQSPNLRLKELPETDWTDPRKQARSLDSLFEKFDKSIIVLSYKKFGVPSIDTLIKVLRRHGKRVRSHSRHYKYALNHQNGTAALNREVLLIAE
ncbi:MAG: DNA adenine methylase [Bryobacteraceae bacterium]